MPGSRLPAVKNLVEFAVQAGIKRERIALSAIRRSRDL